MNHDGNRPATAEIDDLTIVAAEHANAVRRLWGGSLGHTVRCVPTRRTLMARCDGVDLYAKCYTTRAGADGEWRWSMRLREAGFLAPAPVGIARSRARSMAVFQAVPGRSLDAWAETAARGGWLDSWCDHVAGPVAELVARLHARGWVHRDLNLAHLYSADPRSAAPLALIDVERMFEPRWRRRRWLVKDLASLLASCPVAVPARVPARFLVRYASSWSRADRARLAREVLVKRDRIVSHTPRFG